jgi:glycosyltransferase involved in cell wall biosynthesis
VNTGAAPDILAGRADHESLRAFLERFDEFVYFPSISWDHTWERQQTLVSAFAAAHETKTGYLFPPLGLVPYSPFRRELWSRAAGVLKRGLTPRGRGARGGAGYPFPGNIVPVRAFFIPGVGRWRRAATLVGSRRIRSLLRPAGRRFMLAAYVNDVVMSFADRADFVVLDLAERRQASGRLSLYAKELERQLARRADVLVADNRATLGDYASERWENGAPGHYLPQGYTPLCGRKQHTPDGPLAYLGNLHPAIDYEWLRRLIAAFPGRVFRLCGALLDRRAEEIVRLPNVQFWGKIPHRDIPVFLSGVSWGLIPYVVTDWTAGVFPTKLFEYLDAGVPVLSTPIPEVAQFSQHPFIRVQQELSGRLPDADMRGLDEFLRAHTWDARLAAYGRVLSGADS